MQNSQPIDYKRKQSSDLESKPQITQTMQIMSLRNFSEKKPCIGIAKDHWSDSSCSAESEDKEKERKRKQIYDANRSQADSDDQSHVLQQPTTKFIDATAFAKQGYGESVSTTASFNKQRVVKDKEHNLQLSHFQMGSRLGAGKFGEVYMARHIQSGFLCALKRIPKTHIDGRLQQQIFRQIRIQMFLNHWNIVKLYGFFCDEKYLYLVMELCCSGQLYAYLKRKKRLAEPLTRSIIKQVCTAIDFMHSHQILHRDLKPENIIYQNGVVKICDFGWSISSSGMRQTFCGTPLYVSPELLKRKNYNNKIDVWSVGILTYELLFGKVPFEISSQCDFRKIVEDEIKFMKDLNISASAKDFIQICLSKDPRDRYTMPELLEHPFLSEAQLVIAPDMG